MAKKSKSAGSKDSVGKKVVHKSDEARQYRYVVWHKFKGGGGWIAQCSDEHNKQVFVGGRHETQLAAAKQAVAFLIARDKRLGAAADPPWSPATLTLKAMPKSGRTQTAQELQKDFPGPRQSSYMYVYWHTVRQKWETRINHETLGYHTDELAAVDQASARVRAKCNYFTVNPPNPCPIGNPSNACPFNFVKFVSLC